MVKRDPYAALRFKEFNVFLILRFILVFGWSMQFIIIEWQVYTLTKDPLSLGIIGLMEIIPAFSMALFAGHIVDQNEKRNLLMKCIGLFSLISLGLFLLTSPSLEKAWSAKTTLYTIYAFVFMGGLLRAFFGPTIFSLVALIVPKKAYPNAATWNSSTWQMASVLGPAFAGFTINWLGVHWSLCIVFGLIILSFILLFGISIKPILNPKIGEPIMQSLKEGVRFVFKTKAILGALSLDMVAVLFGGAVALLPIFAQDILEVGSEGFGMLRAAPTAGAARNIPNPSDPTSKISCAKIGSKATAPPKRTAIISRLRAPKIALDLITNRTPSLRLCIIGSPIFGFKIGFFEIPNSKIKDKTTNTNTMQRDQ